MHILLMDKIVKTCLQRQSEGDCPTVDSFSVENLEGCIIQLDENVQGVNRLLNVANETIDQLHAQVAEISEFGLGLAKAIDMLHADKARLTKALQDIRSHLPSRSPHAYKPFRQIEFLIEKALAATESNWMAEHDAGVLEEAARDFDEPGMVLLKDVAAKLRRMAAERLI